MSSGSVDAAIGRLVSARHGVFSRAEAFRAGATNGVIRSRLSNGRWEILRHGVYRVAGSPPGWRQDLAAACLAGGAFAVASHRAAFRLAELPGVDEAILEITVPKGREPRLSGVILHHTRSLPRADVMRIDGIPVTTPARTLLDCASVLGEAVLEEALDDALRRGLVSVSRLRWRLRALPGRGRRGAGVLAALLDARDTRQGVPGSVLETRLLRLLRRAGLPAPVPQYRICEAGRLLAIPAFAYPDARIAIEADGWRYHSGRARWQHDLTRRNALTSRGWRVVHVTADDLKFRPDDVCRTVARALGIERT